MTVTEVLLTLELENADTTERWSAQFTAQGKLLSSTYYMCYDNLRIIVYLSFNNSCGRIYS